MTTEVDPTVVDPTMDPEGSTGPAPACVEDTDCSMLDDLCMVGVCTPAGTCIAQALDNGTACDDGRWCTEGDTCMGGACVGDELECESEGPCSVGACNDETESCEQVPDPEMVDMPCDDGDPCTHDGTCVDAACAPGPDACVDLDNDCQMGVCTVMGCQATVMNEGGPCDVGNICTVSACEIGVCVGGAPLNENAACDDGLWCTAYERCIAGACTPEVTDPCQTDQGCGLWTCDDTIDACVVAPENEGAMCDDSIGCTTGTSCMMGECRGGMIAQEVFSEDFADNVAGWTLGTEWEIGPAQQTPCNQEQMCNTLPPTAYPGGDPDLDHTPSDDNGIAGVVIGGIIDQNLHDFYWLESPPFDGAVAGNLTFSYFRWLNSDYTPYIENRVEVFDGVTWITVWASGSSPPIADAPWSTASAMGMGLGWTYQEFDVTPYKNPMMRVRFGFNVDSNGVYAAPGWNVDDVLVAETGCPDGP